MRPIGESFTRRQSSANKQATVATASVVDFAAPATLGSILSRIPWHLAENRPTPADVRTTSSAPVARICRTGRRIVAEDIFGFRDAGRAIFGASPRIDAQSTQRRRPFPHPRPAKRVPHHPTRVQQTDNEIEKKTKTNATHRSKRRSQTHTHAHTLNTDTLTHPVRTGGGGRGQAPGGRGKEKRGVA